MDATLDRIKELKAQKQVIETELDKLIDQAQTELTTLTDGKPRKKWTKRAA